MLMFVVVLLKNKLNALLRCYLVSLKRVKGFFVHMNTQRIFIDFLLATCSCKGLANSWQRHQKVAEYFHAGVEMMGLKLFVKEKVRQRSFYKIYNYQWFCLKS